MKLSLILLVLFSFSSWAEYKRGNQACSRDFEERYKPDSEDLGDQYVYAACTVVKGEDSKGLPLLYLLADHKNMVTSSFFLADYLKTDGRFTNFITEMKIDEAIHYHLRTQALIDLIPTYPEPDYWAYEGHEQMELHSRYSVPILYLWKYSLGAFGDYYEHLFQSPSYQGDRSRETYPKYNTLMRDSLNKLLRYAGECANLPQKRHFNSTRYKVVKQSCRLLEELALTLIPMEEERQSILLQPRCKDLNNETSCPEYDKIHDEIDALVENYNEKIDKIAKPLHTASLSDEDSRTSIHMASTSTSVTGQ